MLVLVEPIFILGLILSVPYIRVQVGRSQLFFVEIGHTDACTYGTTDRVRV